jgi:hypothetical protein
MDLFLKILHKKEETLKTVFLCWNFCVAKRKILYGKAEITQKIVLKTTHICVVAPQKFQHMFDYNTRTISNTRIIRV